MSDQLFPVPDAWVKAAWVDNDKYLQMYEQSVKDAKASGVSMPSVWIGSNPGRR